MRWTRTTIAGTVVVAAALLATACYPPSQTPTDQPIPPGGQVVATGPILTEMWIADATDDLSTILYARAPWLVDVSVRTPYQFWVYDDDTGTTTEVPVGRAEYGTATLAPDGRSVVFASNDPAIQVGPTAINCRMANRPGGPYTYHSCDELYLFDLDTGVTRQLTGLDGSSPYSHVAPEFTDDGTAVDFTGGGGITEPERRLLRLDVASGELTDTPAPPPCCRWDRGTQQVTWDDGTGTLTSLDTTSGETTTLWTHADLYSLAADIGDGRFVVLSRWVNDWTQVFRLVDTVTGDVIEVPSRWISEDGGRMAFVQANVAPEAIDRLILAPVIS
jgi:Tol biopolymer transport system component